MTTIIDIISRIFTLLAIFYTLDYAINGKLGLPHITIDLEEIRRELKQFLSVYFPL